MGLNRVVTPVIRTISESDYYLLRSSMAESTRDKLAKCEGVYHVSVGYVKENGEFRKSEVQLDADFNSDDLQLIYEELIFLDRFLLDLERQKLSGELIITEG